MGNPTTFAAIHYASGEPVFIEVEDGLIRSIRPHLNDENAHTTLPMIAPGLVDLQINGYAGRDFNSLPIADGMIAEVIRLLWRQGVTSCYPTVITNSVAAIHDTMTAIAHACDRDKAASRGIAGIHLEGPFISPDDGARGATPASMFGRRIGISFVAGRTRLTDAFASSRCPPNGPAAPTSLQNAAHPAFWFPSATLQPRPIKSRTRCKPAPACPRISATAPISCSPATQTIFGNSLPRTSFGVA